ncbi:MAG: hypothetical protein ACI9K2_006098 [Myxococcota bacterium]|jgi:hypothetical protein
MTILFLLFACESDPAECGAAECAAVCADVAPAPAKPAEPATPSKNAGLSAFESSHLDPLLADVRAGVRPWDADGLSICPKGPKRTCPEALGATTGELPPGEFIVHAALRVPNVGEKGTWTVRYEQECTTTKTTDGGSNTSTNSYDKEYTVQFITDDKPATLSPLMAITSPNPHGRKECTFTLTAPHPDGDKVYTGGWIVPEA